MRLHGPGRQPTMNDSIEAAAQTVGSVAAGVAFTAEAIEDVADAVVEANRSARKMLRAMLFLTILGIIVLAAMAAYKHLNEESDEIAY